MNLIALTQLVSTGEAKELELLSLEGGFYLLRALTDAGPVTLSDAHGQPVRVRSTTELRQLLADLHPCPACWYSRWCMMRCAGNVTAPLRRCAYR